MSASDFEIEAEKWFYNIVVAHGNGTILNIATTEHLTLGWFSISSWCQAGARERTKLRT